MDVHAGPTLRTRLRCQDTAPAQAREALARLAGLGSVRDDAVLVASELVTNAVVHAGCEPDDEIELVVTKRPDSVCLEVSDPGRSGLHPVKRHPLPTESGGLGLQLVEMLSARWGAERRARVRVWAEVPL